VKIAVTVIAGQLVTIIVAAILGNAEKRASFSNAFTRHRRLQFDTVLEDIMPQILDIIVSAIAGALISSFVGALGGGPVLEEITSTIVLAVAGAIVAAIIAALFGSGEALSAVSDTFNRNLRGGITFEGREEHVADSNTPNC
jgi:ABC-type phosphate/phosphonate transport system permease subunit